MIELVRAISEGASSLLLTSSGYHPRYVQSDWCNREMEAFHAAEPPAGAAGPESASRVFKVAKDPHCRNDLEKLEPIQIRNPYRLPIPTLRDDERDLLTGSVTDSTGKALLADAQPARR